MVSRRNPEASLGVVAPGAGFRGGTLYRPKKGENHKKLQNEKVFAYQSMSFRPQKKKTTNGVTPKW